jgi:serine/threonine protein kinase
MIHTRYEIIRPLGSGSFGQTYLTRNTARPDHPLCVLKQLNPKVNDPASWTIAKALFDREAKTLHQLGTHEQIPQMLDAFEADQEFYLVQEYIEGKTIREELDFHGSWHEPQVTLLLQEILKILDFVHSQGIIHRDIKPENIIRRARDRKLFLIDFGAVKQVSLSPGEQTSLTIVHTCGYSPPEQLEGVPELNSDLYALGMTCIEAFTGIKPELLKQSRNTKTREIDWSKKITVSNECKSILDKMVCMDARDRYPSVSHVMRDLNCLTVNTTSTYAPTEIVMLSKVASDSDLDTRIENDTEQNLAVSQSFHTSKSQSKLKPDINRVSEALTEGSNAGKKVKKVRGVVNTAEQYIKENAVSLLRLLIATFVGLLIVSFVIHRLSAMSRSTQHAQETSTQKENPGTEKKANIEPLAVFEEQGLFQDHQSSIKFLGFTPDGRTLISGSEEGSVKLRNLQTQAVQPLVQTQKKLTAIAKSENGAILAIATEGKVIEIWDLKTRKKRYQLTTGQLSWSLALSTDGQVLAEGRLGSIKEWKKPASKPKLSENSTLIFNNTEPIQATALSSNAHLLVGGNSDGYIKLFNLLNNTSHTFSGHSTIVNAVAIDASETVLFSGSEDDTLRLWHLRTLQELFTIQAELGGIKAIAIHPHSKIVAAGGNYGAVKLWDWRTGQLISSFSNHLAAVTTLAFSPDGQTLVAGDRDGRIVTYTSKNMFVKKLNSP